MSEENPEITFDDASYRLHVLQRELAYHLAIYDAANIALSDCYEIHQDAEEHINLDGQGHISVWAQRVQMASEAVSATSSQVASFARMVAMLTRGVPAGETIS